VFFVKLNPPLSSHQYAEMLAKEYKALMPYDFYSNQSLVNAGIVAEYLTQLSSQMQGEEVFCSRRQEGMDDRVAVGTETRIRARSQQVTGQTEQAVLAQQAARNQLFEELLDKEIDLIRRIMLKASQWKTSARKRSSGSSSKMKTETDYESAANGARQHKIWRHGEKHQATTNGNLPHKVWDPGIHRSEHMIMRS